MGVPVTALSQSLDDGLFIVMTKLTKDKDEQTDDISSIFRKPTDAMFMVEGIQFPCHTNHKVLSKRCQTLCNILLVDGDFERLIKKQRTQTKEQESALLSSSPTSFMAVAELSNVDPGSFRLSSIAISVHGGCRLLGCGKTKTRTRMMKNMKKMMTMTMTMTMTIVRTKKEIS
ncbi:MAG: hypothetical protein ACI90V_007463 [Bacillariaceae sp.]|jgi:hypothetical protein